MCLSLVEGMSPHQCPAAQDVKLTEFFLASRRRTGLLLQWLHREIVIALLAVRQEFCELQG